MKIINATLILTVCVFHLAHTQILSSLLIGSNLPTGSSIYHIGENEPSTRYDLRLELMSIDVFTPAANSHFAKQESIDITWQAELNPAGGNVALRLLNDGVLEWIFSPVTANDGQESVLIPLHIPSGDKYTVEIVSVDDSSLSGVSPVFAIGDLSAKNINVIQPNATSELIPGQHYTYEWSSNGDVGNVKIELFKGNQFVHQHTPNTQNDGHIQVLIPASLIAGNDYKVVITDNNGTVSGESEMFSVPEVQADGSYINFIFPNEENFDCYVEGDTIEILWEDDIDDELVLILHAEEFAMEPEEELDTIFPIDYNIEKSLTSYEYVIPAGLEPGDYKFRLVWNQNGITQVGTNSDPFGIGCLIDPRIGIRSGIVVGDAEPHFPTSKEDPSESSKKSNSDEDKFYTLVKTPEGKNVLLEGDYSSSKIELLNGLGQVVETYNNNPNLILISIATLPVDNYSLKISHLESPNQMIQINFN